MLIRMLLSRYGSINGIDVRFYTRGRRYRLPIRMAAEWIARGWARAE